MRVLVLMGDSGVGKTTISKALDSRYSYLSLIRSYTTRFRRNLHDDDHVFVRKNYLLYKMFHESVIASTIINNELYCAFKNQFDSDKICVYAADDKGFLDLVNHFGLDSVCAVRLKRDNINIDNARANRNLNQIIPDSCVNLNIIQNNGSIDDCCSTIVSLLQKKWPEFFKDFEDDK